VVHRADQPDRDDEPAVPVSWTEVLGSERLSRATLDRLTHRCKIIETKGESYRLQDAKARTNRAAKSVTNAVEGATTSR
jgi:hypothetical protein